MKKLDIHIEAEFGSDFQEEVWKDSLEIFVKAWAIMAKQKHKKNRVWINGVEQQKDKDVR